MIQLVALPVIQLLEELKVVLHVPANKVTLTMVINSYVLHVLQLVCLVQHLQLIVSLAMVVANLEC